MEKWNPDVGIGNAELVTLFPPCFLVPTMIVSSDKEAEGRDQEDEGGKHGRWRHVGVWLVVCGKLISKVVDFDVLM